MCVVDVVDKSSREMTLLNIEYISLEMYLVIQIVDNNNDLSELDSDSY